MSTMQKLLLLLPLLVAQGLGQAVDDPCVGTPDSCNLDVNSSAACEVRIDGVPIVSATQHNCNAFCA